MFALGLAVALACPTIDSSKIIKSSLFGHWTITGIIESRASRGDIKLARPYIGQQLYFSESQFKVGQEVIPRPKYKARSWSDDDQIYFFHSQLSDLGIREPCVTEVEIVNNRGVEISSIGTWALLPSKNRLITVWDGVYFEASRTAALGDNSRNRG